MKRQSATVPSHAKRAREGTASGPGGDVPGTGPSGNSAPAAGGAGAQSMDPDQLSDALMSAGVDLREEENLLTSSVHTVDPGAAAGSTAITFDPSVMFLNVRPLCSAVDKVTSGENMRYTVGERHELLGLLSAAAAEWVAEIVTEAALVSRHRRMSRNEAVSAVSKALRAIAQQDLDAEQQREAEKLSQAAGGKSESKGDSEETQHRAANDTALMMSSGKKRYSWLSGGDSTRGRPLAGSRRSVADSVRLKEVREDPGIVLRDLVFALEQKHHGAGATLAKAYAKLRD